MLLPDLADWQGYPLEKFDLLVSEYNSEDTRFWEKVSQIRKVYSKIPLFILLEKDDLQLKLKAFSLGCNDVLVMPFSTEELYARMRIHQKITNPARSESIKIGNFKLDLNKYRAFDGDSELHLTKTEYFIFEYFMKNPNKVIRKEELLEKVLGYKHSPKTNIIDVHLNHLRKKLRSGVEQGFLIKTIRGIGYTFQTP